MVICFAHSRFSQLKQPLILWLDSKSVQSAAAQKTPGCFWLAGSTVKKAGRLEKQLTLRWLDPAFPQKKGLSMSQKSGHGPKKVTVGGMREECLLYPRTRIYCIIKFSVIRRKMIAQLDYFD